METNDATHPGITISGRMKVKTLKHDFFNEFGLNIRIYDGQRFADDEATLASIRKGDHKGGEFSPRRNAKVGNLEDKMMELFGLKVQISGSDDSYLCDNDLTIAGAYELDEKKMGEKTTKHKELDKEKMLAIETKINNPVIHEEINLSVSKLYRITPLEKKSVVFRIEVSEKLSDETSRGFAVEEHYRWGQGFREFNEPVMDFEVNKWKKVRCINGIGWGAEWDDLVMVDFVWGDPDKFSEKEKQSIKAYWEKGKIDDKGRSGHYWLLEGDHNWHTNPLAPDGFVEIYAPVKIDIVDADNYSVVTEENITPINYENTKYDKETLNQIVTFEQSNVDDTSLDILKNYITQVCIILKVDYGLISNANTIFELNNIVRSLANVINEAVELDEEMSYDLIYGLAENIAKNVTDICEFWKYLLIFKTNTETGCLTFWEDDLDIIYENLLNNLPISVGSPQDVMTLLKREKDTTDLFAHGNDFLIGCFCLAMELARGRYTETNGAYQMLSHATKPSFDSDSDIEEWVTGFGNSSYYENYVAEFISKLEFSEKDWLLDEYMSFLVEYFDIDVFNESSDYRSEEDGVDWVAVSQKICELYLDNE